MNENDLFRKKRTREEYERIGRELKKTRFKTIKTKYYDIDIEKRCDRLDIFKRKLEDNMNNFPRKCTIEFSTEQKSKGMPIIINDHQDEDLYNEHTKNRSQSKNEIDIDVYMSDNINKSGKYSASTPQIKTITIYNLPMKHLDIDSQQTHPASIPIIHHESNKKIIMIIFGGLILAFVLYYISHNNTLFGINQQHIFIFCLFFEFLLLTYWINQKALSRQSSWLNNVAMEDYNSLLNEINTNDQKKIVSQLNFIREKAEKHSISNKYYITYVLPLINSIIQEYGKILSDEMRISSGTLKVWRSKGLNTEYN